MGSPFDPDTASDWWNFGVNVALALATFFAVLFSVYSARAARRDLKEETQLRQQAEHAAATAQIEASRAIAADVARRDVEREDRDRRARVEARAERGADSVRVETIWMSEVTPDLHARVAARVSYNGLGRLTDVHVALLRFGDGNFDDASTEPMAPVASFLPIPHIGGMDAVSSGSTSEEMSYLPGAQVGDQLAFVVRFTDPFLDRWELRPDRSLLLLNPRFIDQASAAPRDTIRE